MVEKSNKVLQVWKEFHHQIFGSWKVQNMWHLQKNVWCVEREASFSRKNHYKSAKTVSQTISKHSTH